VIAIEIQLLLDRLEATLVASRQLPFISGVVVDRDRCFDIINEMRVSIPEEIRKAKRLQQERERLIAHANEEAERIVALAREQAEALVHEHQVIKQAEQQAQLVLERAQSEALDIRAGADEYALEVLKQLETRLVQELGTVRNGILTLTPADRDPVSAGSAPPNATERELAPSDGE
jgi:vacuolar-type H+-ATPase subunit H